MLQYVQDYCTTKIADCQDTINYVLSHVRFTARLSPLPAGEGVRRTGEGETISNTLGYLRGELKDTGKTSSPKGKKPVSFGKRVLEIEFIKKILLAVYNKIFTMYYE